MFDYYQWKDLAPIECVVNVALLYIGERRVVQLDVTYYDDLKDRQSIERLVASADECVQRRDPSGNIVLYLRANAPSIEAELRAQDGTVEGGFRSKRFARLLDPSFYVCSADLSSVFKRERLRRVSIDVIHNGRSGALLVQMLYPTTAREHVRKLYARFEQLSRRIEEFDPTLHTSFTMYTKPGMWKVGPEYVSRQLTTLS